METQSPTEVVQVFAIEDVETECLIMYTRKAMEDLDPIKYLSSISSAFFDLYLN